MTKPDHIKILDFGLAKVAPAAVSSDQVASGNTMTAIDEQHLTSPGSTLGTISYMSPEQARAKEQQIDSIAVIPFSNSGGNADTEFLSDGLTESLIASLAHVPNLKVKSRISVFRYKGKEIDLQQVGKDLTVDASKSPATSPASCAQNSAETKSSKSPSKARGTPRLISFTIKGRY